MIIFWYSLKNLDPIVPIIGFTFIFNLIQKTINQQSGLGM